MPRNQNFLMPVVMMGVGLIAFFLSMRAMAPKQLAVQLQTVVAARNIPSGTMINKNDLTLIPLPPGTNPIGTFSTVESVVGKVSNQEVPQGTVLQAANLISEGDNLATLIPEGYQAVTVKVSTMPIDLGSLLRTGNRIDLLLTYQKPRGEFSSITLMKNVKVIGVGSQSAANFIYLTLAITPDGAKTIAYAEQKGSLSVAIRSFSERTTNVTETFYTIDELFREDVVSSDGKTPAMEEIEVIRGLNKETYRFVKGQLETTKNRESKS